MSLPFLKPKYHQSTGLVVTQDTGSGKSTSEPEGDHAMEAVAEDLLRAINAKDAKHLALAIRSAFAILESEEDAQSEGMED